MTKELTQEYLRSILAYDERTGVFTWRVKKVSGKPFVEAGHVSKKTGYRVVGIDGQLHLAHRLAWLYVYGAFPDGSIDHIDRRRENNAILNLRTATTAENLANTLARSTSKSGVKGVSWCVKTKKWRATITHMGKQKSLGRHEDIEVAKAAYKKEALRLYPIHAATDIENH